MSSIIGQVTTKQDPHDAALYALVQACLELLQLKSHQTPPPNHSVAEPIDLSRLAAFENQFRQLKHSLTENMNQPTKRVLEPLVRQVDASLAEVRTQARKASLAAAAANTSAQDEAAIARILEPVMNPHALPYTHWGLRWQAPQGRRQSAVAEAYASLEHGLSASVAVHIPDGHLWSKPLRVAQLVGSLNILAPQAHWFGPIRERETQLDTYFISQVSRTLEQHSMVLSKRAAASSPGLRVTIHDGTPGYLTIVGLDHEGVANSAPRWVQGTELQELYRLWQQVERSLPLLLVHCHGLTGISLRGREGLGLSAAPDIAQSLVAAAKTLRTQVQHRGRLALPESLYRQVAMLPPTQQSMLAPFVEQAKTPVATPAAPRRSTPRPSKSQAGKTSVRPLPPRPHPDAASPQSSSLPPARPSLPAPSMTKSSRPAPPRPAHHAALRCVTPLPPSSTIKPPPLPRSATTPPPPLTQRAWPTSELAHREEDTVTRAIQAPRVPHFPAVNE